MSKISIPQDPSSAGPGGVTNRKQLDPEYTRVEGIFQIFGIKRGSLYRLIKEGKVRTILKQKAGARSGMRLIEIASVREYLKSEVDSATSTSQPGMEVAQ